jgi:hypothetical protein
MADPAQQRVTTIERALFLCLTGFGRTRTCRRLMCGSPARTSAVDPKRTIANDRYAEGSNVIEAPICLRIHRRPDNGMRAGISCYGGGLLSCADSRSITLPSRL